MEWGMKMRGGQVYEISLNKQIVDFEWVEDFYG